MYQCDLDYRTPEHWRYQADFTVALCLMNKALLFLNILFSCSSIEKRWREVVYNKTPSCQVTAILSSGSTVAVFWQHEDIPKLVEAGSWWTSCWCTLKACMYVNHMEWQGGVSQLYTGMFGFGEFNSQDLRYVIYCCAFSYRIAFFFHHCNSMRPQVPERAGTTCPRPWETFEESRSHMLRCCESSH